MRHATAIALATSHSAVDPVLGLEQRGAQARGASPTTIACTMCCAFLLAARRGRIEGTQQTRPGWTAITALVPETELGSYVGDLRGLTQGQGIATMVHDHLAPLPEHVRPVGAEQLVDATS